MVYYQFSKEQDKVGEDGRPVLGPDGKPEQEKVELDKPIIRFAHVFNAEQVDGIPPLELTDLSFSWEPVEKAEQILSASGATIKHDQSDRAFYRSSEDAIHLPPKENFDAPDKYYATALHELGHWTLHESRLDRENGPFGSEVYAREELRAEIASWMLGQEIGIGHDPGQHAAYVKSWVKTLQDDPYEIVRACRDAEQIKEYLLDFERKRELAQEEPQKDMQHDQREKEQVKKEKDIAAMELPQDQDVQLETNIAQEKTFLSVPYKEKEQAKKLGARWDKGNKLWFAPEGTDLAPLSPWLPEKTPVVESALSVQEEFALALKDFGLDLGDQAPVMDGQIHRVPITGKAPGELDGAYCGFLDGRPAGWMQDFSSGEKQKWAATGHVLTKEQMEAQKAIISQNQEERQQEIIRRQQKAALDAQEIWMNHDKASTENLYLQSKAVPPFGLREDASGTLLIPVMNVDNELRGLQRVHPNGSKSFMYGMEKKGNFHTITQEGADLSHGEILLAEGYATGATLHMATEKPVAVAFDAGNLKPVALKLREKYPNAAITICADNDHQHTRKTPEGVELWNKGIALAQDAAKAVDGKVVAPVFNEEDKARGLSDFNDLYQSRGLDAVKKQLEPGLAKDHTQEKGKSQEISL